MKIKQFAKENFNEVLDTLRALCAIPAPSHYERDRAEFCKRFLEDRGAEGVYIDEAFNVIFPIGCEDSNEMTVIAAHTDTVFPDTEPMPMTEDGEKIYCPGVWDDSVAVAVLLYTALYFIENKIKPKNGILFVCDSGEEGLGNLKGTRALMQRYKGRISNFISFDCICGAITNRAVGSCRYEVEVKAEGGHSFGSFGNMNAIAVISDMISRIYSLDVPEKAGTKTTYNVGTIEGGTSVNTIAQNAKMLCEYRSDDAECLEIMKQKFMEIFTFPYNADITVSVVGERPCGRNVDAERQRALEGVCAKVIKDAFGNEPVTTSGSTDCNIPLSMGIPSVCFGVSIGAGAHTREEWVKKDSVLTGLEMAIRIALDLNKETQ